ncbi:MAG: hypothetical protein ACREPT_02610 [Rudaea sp.]
MSCARIDADACLGAFLDKRTPVRKAIQKLVVRGASLLVAFCLYLPSSTVQAFEPMQPSDRNPLIAAARVKEVMQRFAVAVKKKDMLAFRGSVVVSAALARKFTAEQMNASFKPLMDSGVDLTRLDRMQPVLDGPLQIDEVNQLTVKGHYTSAPPTLFEMRFIREGGHIGLSFIDVRFGAIPAAPKAITRAEGMPDAATIAALKTGAAERAGVELPPAQIAAVRAAMHAFAVAVKHRNMDEFLQSDMVSHLWREQQTAAQLDVEYRNTLASRGDFTLLDQLVPVIPDAPLADGHGGVDISGYYAAPDTRIAFRMGFVDEGGYLRLINFAIAPARPSHHAAKR